jgi:hypothetical protein
MSGYALIPSRRLLALFTFVLGFTSPGVAAAGARVSETYGQLPLHFEASRGQTHEDVRFLARGPGYSLYLTPGEAVLVLARPDKNGEGKRDWRSMRKRPVVPAQVKSVALRMSLVGAALRTSNAERLDLPDRCVDHGHSFGVLHPSPNAGN